jgi:hypothetical protein
MIPRVGRYSPLITPKAGSFFHAVFQPVAITDDCSQSQAILITKNNTDGLCHARKIAWLRPVVNPMFASMH